TAAGYHVLTARDGAEAVALYAQRARDVQVILLDLMMPVLDGAATVGVVQRLNPAARVIVTSGLLTRAEVAQALGSAGKAFLANPYTAETLAATVRAVLDA